MADVVYYAEHDGKSLKLKPGQLKTDVIVKLFHLFPDSIVLVPNNGYVETPDDDDLAVWTVAGDSTKPHPSQTDSHPLTLCAYQPPPGRKRGSGRKWTPAFKTALFQWQKPPGVRIQESDRAGPSSADLLQLEWRKYI